MLQRPHGSNCVVGGQHCDSVVGQSALSRQITLFVQIVAHSITVPEMSQQKLPPQSSLPSHAARKPVHDVVAATHAGPLTKSTQHFCEPEHVALPHAMPTCGGIPESIMLLPLPALQKPFTHG